MIGRILVGCIRMVRPLLGPASCRFTQTCTKYAAQKLHSGPLYKALPLIIARVLLCSPFTPKSWIIWFENHD